MALPCNIDARGKLARLKMGIGLVAVGVILLFGWALAFGATAGGVVSIVLLIGGAFAIFEARAGWCLLRAIGFKTSI